MGLFGLADGFEVGDVLGGEAERSEVRVGEFRKALLIKRGFEVF